MRNLRFIIKDQFEANSLAEDLRVQLDINRFRDVDIKAVKNRNEIIVQVHEDDGELEDTIESFMNSYQSGIILE